MFKFCPNCGLKAESVTFNSFKCKNCHKTYYFNSKPTGSVFPIYKNEVLLAIRGLEPYKGALDSIGGFLKNGEEPLEGSVREFKEETGYKIKKEDLNFLGFVMSSYNFEGEDFEILNILYTINFDSKIDLKPNDDISGLVWLPIHEDYSNHKSTDFMDQVFELLRIKFK